MLPPPRDNFEPLERDERALVLLPLLRDDPREPPRDPPELLRDDDRDLLRELLLLPRLLVPLFRLAERPLDPRDFFAPPERDFLPLLFFAEPRDELPPRDFLLLPRDEEPELLRDRELRPELPRG